MSQNDDIQSVKHVYGDQMANTLMSKGWVYLNSFALFHPDKDVEIIYVLGNAEYQERT